MRALGIDPGYGRCGVAIVEKSDGPSTAPGINKERLVYSDCIETSAKAEFPERLKEIVDECSRIIRTHEPEVLVLEKLYITKNQKTAMRVAEVRGALINLAAQAGIAVFEYTPSEVKSAAAGFGGADKQAVIKMLHALMKIEKEIAHDDEYDAIAVAITHLARHRAAR